MIQDWTQGGSCIGYQRCAQCAKIWAFRRDFCPGCGHKQPAQLVSSGKGVIHAFTRVERAPDDAFRALAPYAIVLVDMEEGFRIMAHGAPDLKIGDVVQGDVRLLAGRLLPYFFSQSSRMNNES